MTVSIRVLVVDDSVVIRRLVVDALSHDPDIEVVGTAGNGKLALAKLETIEVDIITLDIEMPEMNGLETLRALRQSQRRLPVIMFSTLTERGAHATLEALSAGASDYVTKPANMGSIAESIAAVRAELLPKIKALCARRMPPRTVAGIKAPPVAAPLRPLTPPSTRVRAVGRPKLLVIGCSTGGPEALSTVLAGLPANFPLPILAVQHMPPVFTRLFAERLDRTCALKVAEAAGGEIIEPGTVFIAPGDHHLEPEVDARGRGPMRVRLHSGPAENFCRPAVDVLFRAAARVCGPSVLSVVLTGMGSDGRVGAGLIRAAGGEVLVQDEASSVVWGMPGAVVEAGAADEVLPLTSIPQALVNRALRSSGTLLMKHAPLAAAPAVGTTRLGRPA